MANVGDQIGASAKDAWSAVTSLIVNPVGGLGPAYTSLGPTRAMGAGAALAVVFALLAAFGMANSPSSVMGVLFIFGTAGMGFGFDPSFFAIFIKAFLGFLVLAAALAGAAFGARKVASGQAPIAADVFTAGAALTPTGIAMFLSSLLKGSPEIGAILMMFAMAYLILMLFAGLTRAGGISEKAAAPAVPIVLIVALYVCKVVFGALAGNSGGLG